MSDKLPDLEWHLDRRVNIGHILTTIVLAIAGIGVVQALDRRITANEIRIDEMQRQTLEYQRRTIDQMDRIEDKIDRVIEREVDTRENRR